MSDDVKKLLRGKKKPKIKAVDFVSTGSTLLNLACSGRPRCGFAKGHYYLFAGDSNSGKTFLTLTCFAEAANNEHFEDYEFYFDDAEHGALMDWEKFFGQKAAARIQPPKLVDGQSVHSSTVEEFYDTLDRLKREGKKYIYVLDSMDALDAEKEQKSLAKRRSARNRKTSGEEGNKEAAGSYGTAKAKANSDGLREVIPYLRKSGSILIIVSQMRDKIGGFTFGPMMDTRVRSGGKAMTYYAGLELLTTQAGHIKKQVKVGAKTKSRELGIFAKVKTKKNRLQGKDRSVVVPIYHSYGIDDVGGCIDWLVEEGHWKKTGGKINARELEFAGSKQQIAEHIEEHELYRELQAVVTQVWNLIEESCELKRKPRYD